MRFNNQDVAFSEFKKKLFRNAEQIKAVKPYNKGRHWLIKTDESTYYILYRRFPFKTFSKQFFEFSEKNPSYGEEGETINLNLLEIPLKHNAIIVFIYQNGSFKWIHSKAFNKFSKENNLIREQERGNVYNKGDYTGKKEIINETTASIPFSLLEDF